MKKQSNQKENATHMNLVAMAQNVMGYVLIMGKGFAPKEESKDPYRLINNIPVFHSTINIFPIEISSDSSKLKRWGSFYHPFMMMGMPDVGGYIKLYVSFENDYYILWIHCKLDEFMNGKSDFVKGLVAWTPKVKGDSLTLAGFRLFYAMLCQMDFIKSDEDHATHYANPENWLEEWEASANCNVVFSALRNTIYDNESLLEELIAIAPDYLRPNIRKRATIKK